MKNLKIGERLIAATIGIGSAAAVGMMRGDIHTLTGTTIPGLQALAMLSETQNIVMSSVKGLVNPLHSEAVERANEFSAMAAA
jgi:hypothetical protein